MHAREIGEANGWKRLMSNSAKIINILGGYGYETILNSMEKCVISARQGKIVKWKKMFTLDILELENL